MSAPARRRLAAERQRRWRQRALAGRLVVQLELDVDDVHGLVAGGVLSPNGADDRQAIADALRRVLRVLSRRS